MSKKMLTESQIKQIIKEEFAAQGITLTEEEINELFGFAERKLIKQIKELDPDGSELNKLGYDANALKGLKKGSLGQILSDLKGAVGDAEPEPEPEDERGAIEKGIDVAKGMWDAVSPSSEAGTLLGGDEILDMKKRKQLMDAAKAALTDVFSKLSKADPEGAATMKNVSAQLSKRGFPNMRDANAFKTEVARLDQEYENIVKDYEDEKITCTTANVRIAVLRYIVIYYQDFRMGDQYYYRNEELTREDLMLLYEAEQIGAKAGSTAKGYEAAYGSKLPLGLLKAAGGFLVAGLFVNSEFFKNMLEGMKDMKEVSTSTIKKGVETAMKPLGSIEKGDGIIKTVRALGGPEFAKFGTPGGPGLGALNKIGPVRNLISMAMSDPTGPGALAQAIEQNLDPHKLFIEGAKSGRGGTIFGLNAGTFQEETTKLIASSVESVANVPADTLKNKVLNAVGTAGAPVLFAIAVSLAGGALASAGLRYIGKGEGRFSPGSRMSYLKKKVDTYEDIAPCEETGGQCTDEEEAQGKVWRDDLDPPACDCPEGSNV